MIDSISSKVRSMSARHSQTIETHSFDAFDMVPS